MACPHVAGGVAVIWSGNANLVRKIQETRRILYDGAHGQTSSSCSSSGSPNNVVSF